MEAAKKFTTESEMELLQKQAILHRERFDQATDDLTAIANQARADFSPKLLFERYKNELAVAALLGGIKLGIMIQKKREAKRMAVRESERLGF